MRVLTEEIFFKETCARLDQHSELKLKILSRISGRAMGGKDADFLVHWFPERQRCVSRNSCGSLDLDPLAAVGDRLFRRKPSKKRTKRAKHLKGNKKKNNLPKADSKCCSLFNQHHLELRKRTRHGRKENLFQNAHTN